LKNILKNKAGDMSIEQLNFNGKNKVEVALDLIRHFEPTEGYYLAFSGGKDSVVIERLLEMSNVKYDGHYNVTTVDPPELVNFIKKYYPHIERHRPEKTMWQLIESKRMPPTRVVRYCCETLKEGGGKGRFVVTGVRAAESSKRAKRKDVEFDAYGSKSKSATEKREIFLLNDNDEKRRMIETCAIKGKNILNPIINWTDQEVWEFIDVYNVPYCELYDKGYKRLGCIGCPMSTNKIKELEAYPTFKRAYIRAFDKMIKKRREDGLETEWENGFEVYRWWISK
jgi:phosphoadenosine phosphosulfate reductase